MGESSCKRLFVTAIDLGTTYSGYAYQSIDDFKTNPLKIYTNKWVASNMISEKTPTCVLFDEDKKFRAFGFKAEEEYAQEVQESIENETEQYKKFYFFRQFKMILCKAKNKNSSITLDSELMDETGKKLPAIQVFGAAIKYLKDEFLKEINKQYPNKIDSTDVEWVITVPAIWDDIAKQFMQKAAEEACMDPKQLTLALEPEAASIYCQYLKTDVSVDKNTFQSSLMNTNYMVLDLGGGTADITVHHKNDAGQLEEIVPASGGPWGGKQVETNFIGLMESVFGKKTMNTLKKEYLQDYFELCRDFEMKIKNIKNDCIQIGLPAVLTDIYSECTNIPLQTRLSQNEYLGKVTIYKGKIRIKNETLHDLFESVINELINHLLKLIDFCAANQNPIQTILMVGGFSECIFVEQAIQKNMSHMKIVKPPQSVLAVLNGAVIFGHKRNAIYSRRSKLTYGYEAWPKFCPGIHKEEYKITHGNAVCCQKFFQPYVRKGEMIYYDQPVITCHKPVSDEQLDMSISVFATYSDDVPNYIDDPGVTYLGRACLPLSEPTENLDRTVEGRFFFGETVLRLEAKDINTGKIHEALFSCI